MKLPWEDRRQFEIQFDDDSSWLSISGRTWQGQGGPATVIDQYNLGKTAGWLEALSYLQGKSYGETKEYLKKMGLFPYESKK